MGEHQPAVRRIVTGTDADGASILISDSEPPRTIQLTTVPEFRGALVWSTDDVPDLLRGDPDSTESETSFVPEPGGTRLHLMHFPPDAAMPQDGDALTTTREEQSAQMPRLADTFGPDGMHRTDTLDYAFVLSGEIWLELDRGEPILVRAGDIVVQQGTRHAWRNRSSSVVTVAFVFVGGARRA